MKKKDNSFNPAESGKFQERRLFRKRLQDVRIWNQICAAGFEAAAVRLCRGYGFICFGGQLRTSSWSERINKSYNPDSDSLSENCFDYLLRCKRDYLAWAEECDKAGINHRAVIDVLFFGRNLQEVEKIYRHRHGWALSNMLQSFEFYRK